MCCDIVCCDGLTGLPEAIEAQWPRTVVQTCVVHLIRASMRFVSYSGRKPFTTLLRTVYTAVDPAAAGLGGAGLEGCGDDVVRGKLLARSASGRGR